MRPASPAPNPAKNAPIPKPTAPIPIVACATFEGPNSAPAAPPAANRLPIPAKDLSSKFERASDIPFVAFFKDSKSVFIQLIALSPAASPVKKAPIPKPIAPIPVAIPTLLPPAAPTRAPTPIAAPIATRSLVLKASNPSATLIKSFLILSPVPNFSIMASAPAKPKKKAPIPAPAAPKPIPID